MKIYEYPIEVCLEPVFGNASRRDDEAERELEPVYGRYFQSADPVADSSNTQERALLSLFWDRANHLHRLARENGHLGSLQPGLFLERLSALERVAMELKDGAKTPVTLPEAAPFFRPGMGPELNGFSEEQHRLLLDYSLRELRDFGELGLSLQAENEKLSVRVHIYDMTDARYPRDPEIMAFAVGPKERATD